jgi:alanine transaminase
MYAFPRIKMPDRALAVAEDKGIVPDVMYVMRLLRETGLCVVPGRYTVAEIVQY